LWISLYEYDAEEKLKNNRKDDLFDGPMVEDTNLYPRLEVILTKKIK